MRRKSDPRKGRRISATEASRTFSALLDKVETGHRFTVRRHGRDVCVLAPPEIDVRRASECLALLRSRGRVELDDRFGRDLMAVIASEPVEKRPRWGS